MFTSEHCHPVPIHTTILQIMLYDDSIYLVKELTIVFQNIEFSL